MWHRIKCWPWTAPKFGYRSGTRRDRSDSGAWLMPITETPTVRTNKADSGRQSSSFSRYWFMTWIISGGQLSSSCTTWPTGAVSTIPGRGLPRSTSMLIGTSSLCCSVLDSSLNLVSTQYIQIGFILANKCDSPDRAVAREEGERLAREYRVNFMETSAKTGLNVLSAFTEVAR